MLERLLPERSNRTLWWLVVLTVLAFSVLGPVPASLAFTQVFHTPLGVALGVFIAMSVVTATAAAGLMALFLRGPRPVGPGRAIGYVAITTALLTALRLVVYPLLGPELGWRFIVFQVALTLIYFGSVSAAILYGGTLERALAASHATTARTQAALNHEEESVRAQVFDQLHGSLQAEFVAMGRILDDLAVRTTDPDAARTATDVALRLETVYRRGVETIARALAPAGLEVGLVPAVHELEARLSGSTTLTLRIDPIVGILDDPMTGGMRRDVRVAAYRVIEEAVSNAIRHSSATEVDVDVSSTLRAGQPQLLIRVANRRRTRAEFTDGQGLTRMRSRVDALGGDVRITSSPDSFTVAARLPLQAAAPTPAGHRPDVSAG